MPKQVRADYTLEFKQEAVRLAQSAETVAAAARSLGIADQTLHNWVKADRAGKLTATAAKRVSAEQMEIARLRKELAEARMERDILKNRRGMRPPVGVETIARYPDHEGSGRLLFGGVCPR